MNNKNNILTKQDLNQSIFNQIKISLAEKEETRKKELDKKFLDNSQVLKKSPRPVKIYKEDNAPKAVFALLPNLTRRLTYNNAKKPINKFMWLDMRERLLLDPPANAYDLVGINFRKITNEDEQAREKMENDFVKGFIPVLEKAYLVEVLCLETNCQRRDPAKDFQELDKGNPRAFIDNLLKYVSSCGDTKDVLIFADPETFKLIKRSDINKLLEESVSGIINTNNLKNNIKLIIVSQRGILVPYDINRETTSDGHGNDFHFLNINYGIDLMDDNPMVSFKE